MRDQSDELLSLGRQIVKRAMTGVDVAEVSLGQSWDLSVRVRLGKPELVEEAGQRAASLRVLREGRVAVTSTSDLSETGISLLVRDALELCQLSEPDSAAGPAPRELLSTPPYPDLDLLDPNVAAIDAGLALDLATRAEAAALGSDARITLSEGASFGRSSATRALVFSSGFEGVRQDSDASLSVVPVVTDQDDKKRRGYYWTGKRHRADLEDVRFVGEEAARRTLRKLGARKVDTTKAAVIFDPDSARSILGAFAGTIMGGSIFRRLSYLVGRVGTPVASPLVTIIDDPHIPRGPGSRAFDGEGLRSRKNVVVQGGDLQTYLLDWYSARKLGLESTASAARSGGSIFASTSNFLLLPGASSPESIIAETERGLLVTEMMGFGFNASTGDFSRGAEGFWIEDGKIQFPVSEVTISSNLDTMLLSIDRVGSDLELRSSTAAPTIRVASMTISGN